jgi:hypothetical protein
MNTIAAKQGRISPWAAYSSWSACTLQLGCGRIRVRSIRRTR